MIEISPKINKTDSLSNQDSTNLFDLIEYIKNINKILHSYWMANNTINPNLDRGKDLYYKLLSEEISFFI